MGCISKWDICRRKHEIQGLNKLMWSHLIHLQWFIIMWRALKGRLPFDEVLQHKCFSLTSKCNCCIISNSESIYRVFVESEKAKQVWVFFEDKMGITSCLTQLRMKENEWWLM